MQLKDKRREVRISSADDDLLAEAAGLAGVTVSEFLLDRALSDAADLVEAHHSITLGSERFEKFMAALDAPTPVPGALLDQVRRARSLKSID